MDLRSNPSRDLDPSSAQEQIPLHLHPTDPYAVESSGRYKTVAPRVPACKSAHCCLVNLCQILATRMGELMISRLPGLAGRGAKFGWGMLALFPKASQSRGA